MLPFPTLIDAALIERAKKIPVATLCDGMMSTGVAKNGGCMNAAIRAVDTHMSMAGTAVTVATGNGDNLPIHLATYAAPTEGYVMVIDGQAWSECAYIGDLVVGAADAVGYQGIVLDGYSRDLLGTIEKQFPIYSRGIMAAGPIKNDPGQINSAITCGGVVVQAGDLVVGDADGVCVIPREQILSVIEAAEKKLAYEEERLATIIAYKKARQAGEPLPDLAPSWVTEMMAKI